MKQQKPLLPILLTLTILLGIGYVIMRRQGCGKSCSHSHVIDEQVAPTAPADDTLQTKGEIVSIKTFEEFKDKVLNSEQPVVVKVYASWCPPCKKMAPHFKKVAQKLGDQMIFLEVNHETFENALGIDSFPTTIVYKGGEEVKRINGYRDEEQLTQQLTEFLEQK